MVCIIDDDQFVRRGFTLLFKSAGIDSRAFASAEEFLENHLVSEQDIIILDMHMTGMSGCDLLGHFTEKEQFLPVIIVTAYDEPQSRDCAKKYGALAYLRKPVDSEALIDLVRYTMNPV